MPLCVVLHGYRCGVETLALEVFYYIEFISFENLSSVFKFCNLKFLSFTVLVDIEEFGRDRVPSGRSRVGFVLVELKFLFFVDFLFSVFACPSRSRVVLVEIE